MLVVGHDAAEFLQQVEADMRLPVLDRRAQLAEAVADAERPHLVPALAQPRDDVVFGAEFVGLLLGEPSSDSGGTRVSWTSTRMRMLLHLRRPAS